MQIHILNSVEKAGEARGVTVVIDVFRAFTTECFIFANGAQKIIPVLSLDEAYRLKGQNPDFLLVGERGGLMPEGFDYGNSPTEIQDIDFSGKTIIHTTSNGTKGLMLSTQADEILTGSFVNAGAIIAYIQKSNYTTISLVSTSPNVEEEGNEDLMLAYYIRDCLLRKVTDETEIKNLLQKTSAYSLLFNEVGVPLSDFDLCLDINKFPFIIRAKNETGGIILEKINM